MPIAVGARVVCPPYGIGTIARTVGALVENRPTPAFGISIEVAGLLIEKRGEGQYSLGEVAPGLEVVIPMNDAPRRLRDLASAGEARTVLERIVPGESAFATLAFSEKLHRVDHAMRSGSLDACAALYAEALPRLLADATPFGERKALHALERVVIGELALALERPADELVAEIRTRWR